MDKLAEEERMRKILMREQQVQADLADGKLAFDFNGKLIKTSHVSSESLPKMLKYSDSKFMQDTMFLTRLDFMKKAVKDV